MIPKVINYCWFGRKPLPADVRQCITSWKKYCPDYEIKQWDESNFDVFCHPFVKAAYEAKAWAFMSDYARLKIIYDNGGIYLDTDVELLKSLDPLRSNQCYIGVQQSKHLCTTGLGFGATKFNSVVRDMLVQYDDIIFLDDCKKTIACPYLNSRVLEKLGYQYSEDVESIDGTMILPPRYLDPIAPGDGLENLFCEDTISIHHYSASWMGRKVALKRKIIRFIGQERVSKIKRKFRNGK